MHEEPGKDSTNGAERILAERHAERALDRQAGLLVKVCRIAHERGTTEGLDHPYAAHNLSPALIDTFEQVRIRRAGHHLLFHLIGMNHHRHGLVGVEFDARVPICQAGERFLCVFEAALANEPPGRLGREPDADNQRDRPDPLQGKGDLVAPLVVASEHGAQHARGDELANDPAQVDIGRQVGAKMSRAHLGCVGGRQGLEDAPRDTDENLSDEQLDQALGEEDDEDEADAGSQGADQGLAVSEAVGDDTVGEEAEDLTGQHTVGEARLPGSRELVAAVGLGDAKVALERGIGKETGQEGIVEAFHDDTGR